MDEQLTHYFARHGITYTAHAHPAVYTVAEAHAHEVVRAIPGLRCKTLFVRDENGTHYLVGMRGDARLDFKRLASALAVKHLTLGTPEALYASIGVHPGSVSILGAIRNASVGLIIEQPVWDAPVVQFHPNINTETLTLSHDALARYYDSLPNFKRVVSL